MKLFNILKQENLTISFAESITGGKLAYAIIKNPGASDIINEAYVLYSNQAKSKVLSIAPKEIERSGVVSSKIALLMAKNLHRLTKADVCVSTTGYACNQALLHAYVGIHFNHQTHVFETILEPNPLISQEEIKPDNIERTVWFAITKIIEVIKANHHQNVLNE